VPGASTPEAVPGGKPEIAVPGQTPPFPTPPEPVIAVLPVLVRPCPPSAPNDLARPIRTGSARFSTVGAARERGLKHVVNNARIASLLRLRMEDFIMIDLGFGSEIGTCRNESEFL
jgi:hypothetical protein